MMVYFIYSYKRLTRLSSMSLSCWVECENTRIFLAALGDTLK